MFEERVGVGTVKTEICPSNFVIKGQYKLFNAIVLVLVSLDDLKARFGSFFQDWLEVAPLNIELSGSDTVKS